MKSHGRDESFTLPRRRPARLALLGLTCFNVRINLKDITDTDFMEEWNTKAKVLHAEAVEIHDRALAHMDMNL